MDPKERAARFKKARKNANETLRQVTELTKIPKSTIANMENEKSDTNIGYIDIVTLADHYHVNVAWLMGQPGSSPSLNEDIQTVTRVTGLSAEAIANIIKLSSNEKQTINELIESDTFHISLGYLHIAEQMISSAFPVIDNEPWIYSQNTEVNIDNDGNVSMKYTPKESARHFLEQAKDSINNTLSMILINHWNNKAKAGKKNG